MQKISVSEGEFNSVFDVYAYKWEDVEHILTPQIKDNLLILAKKYEALGLCFKGSTLYIGIKTPRDTFDKDTATKRIDYDNELQVVRKDIDDIIEVIEFLG